MLSPVKLGAAAIGTAGAATTAYYGINHFVSTSKDVSKEDQMPEWRPLVQDTGFWSGSDIHNDYKTNYAGKYARLLVGVGTAKTNEQAVSDNKDWWEWAYKNLYKQDDAKGGFKDSVQKGSKADTPDSQSLQEVCEKAYKASTGNVIETDPKDTETSKFKEEQIWKFCSPIGQKPEAIGEVKSGEDKNNVDESNGSWNNKIGGKNKNDLLAISTNAKVWEQLDKQSKHSNTKPTSGFFSDDNNGADIKAKCTKAYGIADVQDAAGTDNTKPKEEDLYKWCSLKGKKTTTSSG